MFNIISGRSAVKPNHYKNHALSKEYASRLRKHILERKVSIYFYILTNGIGIWNVVLSCNSVYNCIVGA